MSLRRLLYTIFLYFIFPLVLLRLLWRSRRNPDYRKRLIERLGIVKNRHNNIHENPGINSPVTSETQSKSNSTIWLHAVSVGETIAAKPLIVALLESYPEHSILITTTTPTGSDRVVSLFADQIKARQIIHVYFPYDLLGAVSRFIRTFKPMILIVVETEIWPNLYAKCHQKQVPVLMVNARLSEKSTQSYLKIKGLVEETLLKVNTIAVRSNQDAERFISLGAKPSQIEEVGNIKYDINIDQIQFDHAQKYLETWSTHSNKARSVFVAASTHKGEDEKILSIYLSLLKQVQELILVLVPRHPERFDDVHRECLNQLPDHFTLMRHSENVNDDINKQDQKIDVILGDSMGEMQMWFATADVVFIGGSLVKTGGHNPLEATVFGVPVVSGPHMFNFEDIATDLIDADLMFVCDNESEVIQKLLQLLCNNNTDEYSHKADRFMQKHRGVTARLTYLVSKLV